MHALISPLAIAPMIDWTNTHFRVFMRLIAPKALLYTEMLTPQAVINNPQRALAFQPNEHPLAIQLGGSHPDSLVQAGCLAEKLGFSEINLNLGCPSDRVQAGQFGACLMAQPHLVVDCIHALKQALKIPITVKIRLGIDNQDSYEFFANFVNAMAEAGSDKIIIHARKAWLHGLNPKQNRTIPPICYEYVYQIKKNYPLLPIVLNGNIIETISLPYHMQHVDGVMVGRLACNDPYRLAQFHKYFYPECALLTRAEVIERYLAYVTAQFGLKVPLSILLKPLFNINHQQSHAKSWKQRLLVAQQSKDLTGLNIFV